MELHGAEYQPSRAREDDSTSIDDQMSLIKSIITNLSLSLPASCVLYLRRVCSKVRSESRAKVIEICVVGI